MAHRTGVDRVSLPITREMRLYFRDLARQRGTKTITEISRVALPALEQARRRGLGPGGGRVNGSH